MVLKNIIKAQTAIINTEYKKRSHFLLENILEKFNIIT